MSPSPSPTSPPPHHRPRRKLRPLIITEPNSKRHNQILNLFTSTPSMLANFETPDISPAVPSRTIRSRFDLLSTAHKAGIIPEEEWAAISTDKNLKVYQENPEKLLDCLNDVPIRPRFGKGTEGVHYCTELWRKSKGLNRGRSVLACVLAHLIAMKKFVEGDYDVLLEDNVRAPIGIPSSFCPTNEEDCDENEEENGHYCECAERIWNTMEASQAWENEITGNDDDGHETRKKCHLRYYGWLGSIPNLEWLLNEYAPKTSFTHHEQQHPNNNDYTPKSCTSANGQVFPFPSFVVDINNNNNDIKQDDNTNDTTSQHNANTAGGTPIWGAYAYWISREGHEALLESLRHDVGAILWKGKRMRCYLVKPIDKILPRRILSMLGDDVDKDEIKEGGDGFGVVHVTTTPAFFRAPMLSSKIHPQWDEGFCRSTEYQMGRYGRRKQIKPALRIGGDCDNDAERFQENRNALDWDDLWLTSEEREIVAYKKFSAGEGGGEGGVNDGVWLTLVQLFEKKKREKEDGDAQTKVR